MLNFAIIKLFTYAKILLNIIYTSMSIYTSIYIYIYIARIYIALYISVYINFIYTSI